MPTPPRHRLNFTQIALTALPVPPIGRTYHHDAKTPGLVLAITCNDCRSFLVYRKLNGKPIKVTLGRFPPMAVEQARKRAAGVLGQLVEGINPIAERRVRRPGKSRCARSWRITWPPGPSSPKLTRIFHKTAIGA